MHLLGACLVAGATIVAAGHPRVHIQDGSIIGKALTVSNATANAYLGIPFAKPPTRFRAPEAADAISGEFDGTEWKSSCMQSGTGSGNDFLNHIAERHGTDSCQVLHSTTETQLSSTFQQLLTTLLTARTVYILMFSSHGMQHRLASCLSSSASTVAIFNQEQAHLQFITVCPLLPTRTPLWSLRTIDSACLGSSTLRS